MIPLPAHSSHRPDDDLSSELHTLARSLLGALSWVTQSRHEIQVFVGLCQRSAEQLKYRHAQVLNLSLKWIQQHHSGMRYSEFDGSSAFYCIVDSAFRADEPDCLALRADIMGLCQHTDTQVGGKLHTFVTTSKKQSRVNRNTFSAEAGAVGDAISMCIVLAGLLHEIDKGSCPATTLANCAENGGFSRKIIVFTDSESFFKACTATEIQLPTERHLAYTVMKVREWLERDIVSELIWIDTRDMLCDGFTKGSISRFDVMNALNQGYWTLKHTPQRWSARGRGPVNSSRTPT